MKIEQVAWNKTASYNLFAFAGLKPQFATGYWAVYLRDMPILNNFGSPSLHKTPGTKQQSCAWTGDQSA